MFSNSVLYLYHGVHPLGLALFLFYSTIEVDRKNILGSCLLPGITIPQPVIRLLNLSQRKHFG